MSKGLRWILYLSGLLLLALSFSPPLPGQAPRLIRETWQFGHVLLFFCWVYLLLPHIAKRIRSPWPLIGLVILAGMISGLVIEGLQLVTGRDFSLQDMVYNLAGILLALSLHSLHRRHTYSGPVRNGLYLSTLLLCLYVALPFSLVLADDLMLYRQFPGLADFDSRLELSRWQGNVSLATLDSPEGTRSVMQVDLDRANFSGAYLGWLKRDWRGFQRLCLDLYVPGKQGLELTLRIHDALHFTRLGGHYNDRFNRKLRLQPGWNEVSINLRDIEMAPRNRPMDMASIQEVALFSAHQQDTRRFFIDSMRLK